MIMKKKIIMVVASILVFSLVAGCGEAADTTSQEIELVEPVGVSRDYAVADFRDLTTSKILPGKIVPKTTEISFSTAQRFESYGALPGTEVTSDTAVLYASTKDIDEQIKALKESMEKAQEEYSEFLVEENQKLAEAKADEPYYYQIVQNFANLSEEEKKTYPGMGYEAEYAKYRIAYADACARKDRAEQNIKEKTELYEVDRDYNNTKLRRLNIKRNNVLALAGQSGTVVAVNFYDNGQYIDRNVSVAAIGDFTQLEIKVEQVYKSEVKKAEDVYALVNGKRYEVVYKEYNAEEDGDSSSDSTASNPGSSSSTSYSTFLISDPEGTVKAGDFATIVLITKRKNNVLCVPKDSISTDQDGSFVYVLDNDQTVYTPVTTGISSGYYTEILSGLEPGDKVTSELKIKTTGSKTSALTTGKITTNYKEGGYLFYSKTDWVQNPVEYGTTYLESIEVKQYQRVEKGQVIAKIRVQADSITIRRNERTLQRANEDLKSQLKANEGKEDTKAIKLQREYIAELEKKINQMKSDSKITEIKAPYNGIITRVNEYSEGDLIFTDTNMVQISAEEDCFVVVEDQNGQLTCGLKTSITYKDANGQERVAIGEVVTVAPCALSKEIDTGYSLIKVSPEDMESMAASNQGADGWWMRSRFTVTAEPRSVSGVVLVPKSAVTVESGVTYVTVLDENNEPVYKSFVAGGSDNTYYWVAEGLSEGTNICLE